MTTIPSAWIERLFQHFRDIYDVRADGIDKTIQLWQSELAGVNAEQIKTALDACRLDTSALPTPTIFKRLCHNVKISVLAAPAVTTTHTTTKDYYMLLKPPTRQEIQERKALDNAANLAKEDRKVQLMTMDETAALALSTQDKYDRTRYLLQQEGRDTVQLFARAHEQQAVKFAKPDIKRKDWS